MPGSQSLLCTLCLLCLLGLPCMLCWLPLLLLQQLLICLQAGSRLSQHALAMPLQLSDSLPLLHCLLSC